MHFSLKALEVHRQIKLIKIGEKDVK